MRTAIFFVLLLVPATAGPHGAVAERVLLDNARMTVTEYAFPPGFKGETHVAVADELAYVIDGEFTVLMLGPDRKVVKRVLRAGEVDYAEKGTLHSSHNVSGRPARVVVVLLKDPSINPRHTMSQGAPFGWTIPTRCTGAGGAAVDCRRDSERPPRE